MRNITLSLAAAGIAITGAACSSGSDPLPTGSDQFPTTATTAAAGVVEEVATTVTTAAPPPSASTCDVTREALLTGTQDEINASMNALVADKTADGTAREYAATYLRELTDDYSWAGAEAENIRQTSMEGSAALIRMYCS